MRDPVVYLAPSLDDTTRQKIAEFMRIHNIRITDDRAQATVFIIQEPTSTLAAIAEQLIADTELEFSAIVRQYKESLLAQPILSVPESNKQYTRHHNRAQKPITQIA